MGGPTPLWPLTASVANAPSTAAAALRRMSTETPFVRRRPTPLYVRNDALGSFVPQEDRDESV